jgi:predicted regulator of Ras-like GTPase activity (Roadblock/LC7/MglB family)
VSVPEQSPQDLNWLVTNFVERVPDAAHAVIVSADGLSLAVSAGFPAAHADQVAVVTSGLSGLTQGAARVFDSGIVVQTVVEMEAGVMVIMTISIAACLAVLAAPEANMDIIAYEMTLLVERAGRMITPPTRRDSPVAVAGNER